MRQLFAVFDVPREISTDGASKFVASETTDFYNRWCIDYKQAHHPVSNGREELGGEINEAAFLHDNVDPGGSLGDRFLRVLLSHRTTPD